MGSVGWGQGNERISHFGYSPDKGFADEKDNRHNFSDDSDFDDAIVTSSEGLLDEQSGSTSQQQSYPYPNTNTGFSSDIEPCGNNEKKRSEKTIVQMVKFSEFEDGEEVES